MTFQKAVKHEAKLRLAIAGPSGSGKTYSALAIAANLGGPVALVDTEHGSASKYADLFTFDVSEMEPPFNPNRFVEAIHDAEKAGYNVLILDSLTHAWSGTGGLLDVVDEIARRKAAERKTSPNSFEAWKDATPIQNRLVDAIIGAHLHIIATIRSKQDYSQEKDDRGRTVIKKVGMAPQQREGFEYEFDVFAEMDIENSMAFSKTRCPDLTGKVIAKPGKEVAAILTKWLHGAPATVPAATPSPAPAPTPEPQTPPPAPANGNGTQHPAKLLGIPKGWQQAGTHLAEMFPAKYRTKAGAPDFNHILYSAAAEGVEVISDSNLDETIDKIIARQQRAA